MAGGYAYKPEGVQAIAAEFRGLQNQIDALRRGLTGLGIQIDPSGNLIVNQNAIESANFDGNVAAGTAGTAGWGLGGAAGNAVFNNITLRGGIVGNDALTNPVSAAVFNGAGAYSLTFTSSYATYVSKSITVPAGFSQGLVVGTVSAACPPNGVFATLGCIVRIAGTDGPELIDTSSDGNNYVLSATSFSRVVTGLSGGTITVEARVKATTVTNGAGSCTLSGFVVFLR